MSDVVTGDAVVLELRLARFPARLVALAVDVALVLVALVVLSAVAAGVDAEVDDALSATLSLLVVVGLLVGLPTTVETLTRGRSLGKLVMGLRVVRDDGGPVRFRQSLTRALFGVVEIWMTTGVVALFASLLSEQGKRLGDQFAGTVVVRERMPVQGGQVSWMPPFLAPWALSADLARVPDSLLFEARQLVSRLGDLDDATRFRLCADLARRVAAYVAPPSPPGTPPDAYLLAVVTERRRRDALQPVVPTPAPPAGPPAHAPVPPPAPAPPPGPAPEEAAPETRQPGGFAPPD